MGGNLEVFVIAMFICQIVTFLAILVISKVLNTLRSLSLDNLKRTVKNEFFLKRLYSNAMSKRDIISLYLEYKNYKVGDLIKLPMIIDDITQTSFIPSKHTCVNNDTEKESDVFDLPNAMNGYKNNMKIILGASEESTDYGTSVLIASSPFEYDKEILDSVTYTRKTYVIKKLPSEETNYFCFVTRSKGKNKSFKHKVKDSENSESLEIEFKFNSDIEYYFFLCERIKGRTKDKNILKDIGYYEIKSLKDFTNPMILNKQSLSDFINEKIDIINKKYTDLLK